MSQIPYAASSAVSPFPALTALVGRAAVGGPRETALGCLMAARLAWAVLPEADLPQDIRASRAKMARTWMSALTLPVAVRVPLARAIDATALTAPAAADALRALATSAARIIDAASRGELVVLAERIASGN